MTCFLIVACRCLQHSDFRVGYRVLWNTPQKHRRGLSICWLLHFNYGSGWNCIRNQGLETPHHGDWSSRDGLCCMLVVSKQKTVDFSSPSPVLFRCLRKVSCLFMTRKLPFPVESLLDIPLCGLAESISFTCNSGKDVTENNTICRVII